MGAFTNKIDFEVVIMVNHGNPNGDPLNGNRPREDFDGFGEISDVCLKSIYRHKSEIYENTSKSSAGYGRENFYTKRRTL